MNSMGVSSEDKSLSGAFAGHIIPASFFLCFGVYLLGLTMHRAVRGTVMIPERNERVLFLIGTALMVCTTCGLIGEAVGGFLVMGNPFFQSAHETLYFLFFFAGICTLLESYKALPPDSSRCGVAVALLGEYILWHEHALMKSNMVDQRIHTILANISLSNCAIIAWSVHQGSRSILAYVLGFALFVLQGLWLMTAAFNIGIHQVHSLTGGFLTQDNVGVFFCVEIIFVGFALVFGSAYVYSRREKPDDEVVATAESIVSLPAKLQEYVRLSREAESETTLEYA